MLMISIDDDNSLTNVFFVEMHGSAPNVVIIKMLL